ncbi:MAG TPA: efflux RND transporter periplasmic adaptor subunit [Albitalea sp.]
MSRRRWIALTVLLLLGLGAAWWFARGGGGDVQYRTARIERGSLQATVAASGTVTPVTQVQVGTQVSGQIKELYADFNSEVKAGQLLARIDPEAFEYKLRQVQADLDSARASVLNAQANATAAQAAVSRATVDLHEAQRALQRNQELVAQNFISPAQLDTSRALVSSQSAGVRAAQAQVQVAQAQIASAQAAVKQREALVAQAKVDIERTQVRSPVDGVVIKRSVELGQTVAASLQAPELFVIAQNLSDMQVQTSIDEADISRVKLDQTASFTVDAFPGRSFEGRVSQVRKSATNTQNVITYTVVVNFSNPETRLLPGMTANVRLVTDTRDNVLKVPNAALRVRLPGVQPAANTASGSGPADAATRDGEVPVRRAQAQERPEGARPQAGQATTAEPGAAARARTGEGGRRQSTRGRIHLLESGKPRAVDVRLGITDGTMTELIVPPNSPDAARLVEGAEVIVGTVAPGSAGTGTPAPAGPRMRL